LRENQKEKPSGTGDRVLLPEESGRADQQTITEADTDYLLLGLEQAPLH